VEVEVGVLHNKQKEHLVAGAVVEAGVEVEVLRKQEAHWMAGSAVEVEVIRMAGSVASCQVELDQFAHGLFVDGPVHPIA
jgi:hypothetical protein